MKYTEKAKVKILPKPAPMAHSPQTPSPLVSVSPRYANTPILPAPKRSKSAASVSSTKPSTPNAGPELKKQRKSTSSASPRERPPNPPDRPITHQKTRQQQPHHHHKNNRSKQDIDQSPRAHFVVNTRSNAMLWIITHNHVKDVNAWD